MIFHEGQNVLMGARRSDIALLLTARGLRGFGDGFAIIVLPVYLSVIGFTTTQIGIIATISLLGTASLTLAVGLVAPRFELRHLLLIGAAAMALTGLAFPNVENFVLLAAVAFIGTANPSSGDLGMLVPLEHAVLTREASERARTGVFAKYSLVGSLTTAAGSLAAATPQLLTSQGITEIGALKLMFYVYGALGLLAALLYGALPRLPVDPAVRVKVALGTSRRTVYKLAALFSLDAFAGGFVVQSLLALWLFQQFDLSLAAASSFFFLSSLLSALSYPVAAWLARRIGLINTMVFTHIPSSIFLILAAFATNLTVVLVLLLLRAALSQMDVPTRSSYVMAVVTPAERPAAASVTAVPRSLASSISPTFAGLLLAGAFPGLPLVICGVLKIGYDAALLYTFRHINPPEESSR